jgi:BirA family transcriptional regulator, biotin operon repressor / biotin---[acetyl-CoA-carboxylase] ligase
VRLADPQFPPLLKGHALAPRRAPFAEACRRARAHELGAAEVVWSRSTTRAACAIVLEPEVSLATALQMAPLLMVALGDCLGTLCPPQVAVEYRWPRGILLNGTSLGEVRIAAPRVPASEVPNWLVVGAEIAIAAPPGERRDWSTTSLAEEAGGGITRSDVLRSLAAHFLTWLNTWQERGFPPVHAHWLLRAEGRLRPVRMADRGGDLEGQVIGLSDNGDLRLRDGLGKVHGLAFIDHVELHDPC